MNEVKARRVLEILADPGNWIGDPTDIDAELTGHDTPYEMACEALADMELKTIHLYGASDDLMEIEGEVKGCDEYPGEKATFHVAGARIDFKFDGEWLISVGPIDEDVEVQADNIRTYLPLGSHSPHVYLDVPEGSYISRVGGDE